MSALAVEDRDGVARLEHGLHDRLQVVVGRVHRPPDVDNDLSPGGGVLDREFAVLRIGVDAGGLRLVLRGRLAFDVLTVG